MIPLRETSLAFKALWKKIKPSRWELLIMAILLVASLVAIIAAVGGFPALRPASLEAEDVTSLAALFLLLVVPSAGCLMLNFVLSANALFWSLRRLERRGQLEEAMEEVRDAGFNSNQVCLTEHYLLSKEFGALIPFADMVRCYEKTEFFALSAVKKRLIVCTADGKQAAVQTMRPKGGDHNFLGDTVEYILERNPNVLCALRGQKQQ